MRRRLLRLLGAQQHCHRRRWMRDKERSRATSLPLLLLVVLVAVVAVVAVAVEASSSLESPPPSCGRSPLLRARLLGFSHR